MAEVDTVVDWLTAARAGVHVIIGAPGTGKSAILGRVVSLADAVERARLTWSHADPGVGAVHAAVHARGLDHEGLSKALDDRLCAAGHLARAACRREVPVLLGAIRRLEQRPVVVVDGLDEAGAAASTIAGQLLCPLARHATVIVSTCGGTDALAPVAIVDLDAADAVASSRLALREYVTARLADLPQRDAVAERLADGSFLRARLVVDQLLARPVDTTGPGRQDALPASAGAALDDDLHGRVAHRELATAMLVALTWGLGSGFPEGEWHAAAGALTGRPVGFGEVGWLRKRLGRYLEEDAGTYRLAHHSLAEHLRPPSTAPFHPDAARVGAALLRRYRSLQEAGAPEQETAYLAAHAWRHAVQWGPAGVAELQALAVRNPDVRVGAARACHEIAAVLRARGEQGTALRPAADAVELCRQLAADEPAARADLAATLTSLGVLHSELGDPVAGLAPAEEAVRLYRDLAADDAEALPHLGTALANLGTRYVELDRAVDALPVIEEAVDVNRPLVADNPTRQTMLAVSLANLGVVHGGFGPPTAAVAPLEEAVSLFRQVVDAEPAGRPSLAGTLDVLRHVHELLGRPSDALPPAHEAVTVHRDLARDDPVHVAGLAVALGALEGLCIELGHPEVAEQAWDEAAHQLAGRSAAELLVLRSRDALAGTAAAARWLLAALHEAPDDGQLAEIVWAEERRHRAVDLKGWRAAWADAAGGPPPRWLFRWS